MGVIICPEWQGVSLIESETGQEQDAQFQLMARKLLLIDIYGKPHNFACPPWRVVQIRNGLKAI